MSRAIDIDVPYGKHGGSDLPDQAIRVPVTAEELGAKLAEAFDISN